MPAPDPPPEPRPSDPVLRTLARSFGHPSFRAGQEPLVRAVLGGRDGLGILPTGGGKSVCYMLPALLLPGLTVVASPLVSLMRDQLRRAREVGLEAEVLDSTLERARRSEIVERARAGGLRLLLLSPERLASPAFRAVLPELRVSLLAVDEAHCISAWGHDFRPEYLRLGEVRPLLRSPDEPSAGAVRPTPPVLALTATATPRVRAEIRSSLRLHEPLEVVGDFDRPNLSLAVVGAGDHTGKMRRLGDLLRGRPGAVVVYASTRRAVEAVRRALSRRGLPVEAYHAGLPSEERSRVQEAFLSLPRPVVVATNAFGMGIDRADVRLVVHYQLPGTLEAYYQEAGRAGRDGTPARCVGLTGRGDRAVHRRFLDRSHPAVPALRFLRKVLAEEFGEERRGSFEPAAVAARISTARDGRVSGRLPLLRKLPWRRPDPVVDDLPHLLAALVRTRGAWADPTFREALERWIEAPRDEADRILRESHGFPGTIGLPSRWDACRADLLRRGARDRLRAVEAFVRGRGCRKRRLLAYFGQASPAGGCGACDRCGIRA